MKVTETHLRYWQERQPTPAWVDKIQRPKLAWAPKPGAIRTSIHEVINVQAGLTKRCASMHTLPVLRKARESNTLVECLLVFSKGDNPNTVRRARWARKWLVRIMMDRSTRLTRLL